MLWIPSLSWLLDMRHLGPVRLFKERCYSLKINLVLNQGRDSPRLQRCQLRLHLQVFKGKTMALVKYLDQRLESAAFWCKLKNPFVPKLCIKFLAFFSFLYNKFEKAYFYQRMVPGSNTALGWRTKYTPYCLCIFVSL